MIGDEPVLRVVIADDHAVVRSGLRMLLDMEPDFVGRGRGRRRRGDDRLPARARAGRPDPRPAHAAPRTASTRCRRCSTPSPATRVARADDAGRPGVRAQGAARRRRAATCSRRPPRAELVAAVRAVARGGTYLHPQLGARRRGSRTEPATIADARASSRCCAWSRSATRTRRSPSELYLSVRTVETHRANIQRKLGVSRPRRARPLRARARAHRPVSTPGAPPHVDARAARARGRASGARGSSSRTCRCPPTAPRRRRLVVAAALALFAGDVRRCGWRSTTPARCSRTSTRCRSRCWRSSSASAAGLAAAAFAFALVVAWGGDQGPHVGRARLRARGGGVRASSAGSSGASPSACAPTSPRASARSASSSSAPTSSSARTRSWRAASCGSRRSREIARAVGGETDLQRVLAADPRPRPRDHRRARRCRVPARGRRARAARRQRAGGRRGRGPPAGRRLAARRGPADRARRGASSPAQLASSASPRRRVLVPLAFRGERLGVLAAIDRRPRPAAASTRRTRSCCESVAASAATAVTTAQSVARERLRNSDRGVRAGAPPLGARAARRDAAGPRRACAMLLSSALADGTTARCAAPSSEAVEQTKGEIGTLRGLIAELRPAALDELGLGPAIETLAERSAARRASRFDTELELAPDGERTRLPPGDREHDLPARAGGADERRQARRRRRRARCASSSDNGAIEVAVRDDGRGFDPDAPERRLRARRHARARRPRGRRLRVASRDGGPTTVEALVPLSACGRPRLFGATTGRRSGQRLLDRPSPGSPGSSRRRPRERVDVAARRERARPRAAAHEERPAPAPPWRSPSASARGPPGASGRTAR